jgi:DNA repair protein RadC
MTKNYKSNIPKISLVKEPSDIKKVKFESSKDAADYARQFYGSDIEMYESVFLILLNAANNTIGWVKVSQGGITGSVIDVKMIAKYSVQSLASSVILVHNHPSGNIMPSVEDDNVTKNVKEGLNLLDIRLLDHIILTEDRYYSYSDDDKI